MVSVVVIVAVVAMLLGLLLATQSGSRWALGQLITRLNALPGQQFTLQTSSGTLTRGLELEGFSYASDTVRLSIGQVELDWRPGALLSRRVLVTSLLVRDVEVELLPADPATTAPPRLPGEPLLNMPPLPVQIDLERARVQDARYRQGELELVLNSLTFTAQLAGLDLSVSDLALASPLAAIEGDLALALRDMLPLQATLDWHYPQPVFPESGPSAGSLSVSGDLATLTLAHRLTRPVLLVSDGVVQTGLAGDGLMLDLTHGSESLLLPQSLTGTPLSLAGLSVTTRGDPGQLQITLGTVVQSEVAPPATLAVDALWQGDALVVDRYDLRTDTGALQGSAVVNITGAVNGSLAYELTETTPTRYLPPALRGQAESALPLALGKLRSRGTLEFAVPDQGPQVRLSVAELTGELGEFPFRSAGGVNFQDGVLQLDNLNLVTADNQLRIAGTLGDTMALDWEINAPRLDQYLPGLQGRLRGSGAVAGALEDLQLTAAVTLEGLRYQGLAVDALRLDLSRREDRLRGELLIDAGSFRSGERLERLESLHLLVEGTDARHRLTLEAASSVGGANLAAEGGFTDLAALLWNGRLTDGELATPAGDWSLATPTPVSIAADAIQLGDSCWQQGAASVCLSFAMPRGATESPMALAGRVNGYPLAMLNPPRRRPAGLPPLPAALAPLPEAIELGGLIDVEFDATLGEDTTVEARILPRNIALTVHSSEAEALADTDYVPQTYLLLEPNLEARLTGGDWSALANFGVGRRDPATGTVEPGGNAGLRLALVDGSSLDGRLSASFGSLDWLGPLIPQARGLGGSLAASVALAGTLSAPRAQLDIQLRDGTAEVPALGLQFSDLAASLLSQGDDLIMISAGLRSNQGDLAFSGRVLEPFAATRRAEARVTGTDFTLADLPDLSLAISPDLQLSADANRIGVTGDLHTPLLNITVRELSEQAVDVSRDTVVMDFPSDHPELASSLAAEQASVFNVPIVADVNITLGDQVSLSGFGFTSMVAGSLNVRQQENGTNLTYGELEIVRGDYRMYGQSLEIRGGKLLFFGAMDNPALDIRATRTVEDTTVGVLMNGTVKNINSQLFSTPALPDSDIIAILATGRPFSQIGQGEQDRDAMLGSIARLGLSRSQGLTNQVREQLGLDTLAITGTGSINNTTLTIGKYLTPDIFIRYGFGIFDHQSKLALDYLLTERITLQAETGEYQSVDVIYRVEQ